MRPPFSLRGVHTIPHAPDVDVRTYLLRQRAVKEGEHKQNEQSPPKMLVTSTKIVILTASGQ